METDPDLQARMTALEVAEEDLEERFVKGSGPGGQKINKTASCVFLRHPPSGLEVKCQDGRSLQDNRLEARRRLCQLLEDRAARRREEAARREAKTRFQKRKRSRRQKAKILADKRHRSRIKGLRGKPGRDD